jgi:hypothetical protein
MAQTMYIHVNKCKNDKIKERKKEKYCHSGEKKSNRSKEHKEVENLV